MIPVMKRPTRDQLAALSPNASEPLIDQHLSRLDDAYFERFAAEQVAQHLDCLSRLSAAQPVVTRVEPAGDGLLTVTVFAHDQPGLFAVISGVLAGLGFGIRRGDVFTYARAETDVGGGPLRGRRRSRFHRGRTASPSSRRRIIDQFIGALSNGDSTRKFAERLQEELAGAVRLLEAGGEQNVLEARHRVNEMVTRRLGRLELGDQPVLYPVQIDVMLGDPKRTWLQIAGQDTPAFLYAMTTALSLQGMTIERLVINTEDDTVQDEIGFVGADGKPVQDVAVLNRVKLSALMTKQFTYFLDKSPDPYTALSRFEKMVDDLLRRPEAGQWMEMLGNPRSMQKLARLLGTSDYLWEQFIRMQYDALLPILEANLGGEPLCGPMETVRQRLYDTIARADTPSEQRKALNRFKDAEVFRIDLDHIVRSTDFRDFAARLTALAEAVVNAATDLAWVSLTDQHGQPRDEQGKVMAVSVFGLGKLGGVALGYASDIELMYVYDGTGRTDGRQPIHAGEFFNVLVREATGCIEAKQEGIFRTDLRLRPYGKNSPLAVSRETFEKYYAADGDAQAFERQALVRMRWIGGDRELGSAISFLRDRIVYDQTALDLAQLWQMRQMQYRQKKRGDQFNAKYSPGALVDVEYSVQTLQVMYGGEHAQLRTPRVHEAIDGLRSVGVIDAGDAEALRAAYDFFRRLINGLRMLRGSAKDLFVPPVGTNDLTYLARRMGYTEDDSTDASAKLNADIAEHADAVLCFVRSTFGEAALPTAKVNEART